jgi:F420-dependent oxidoreductase-like protein
MQLGLNFGYATTAAEMTTNLELAVLAEELGYDVVWAAEAYGSDAVSMLAAIAARTQRIDIGSAVLQIPGRTPALTAMTAASLDALSGGRFRLGLGVSGPQVSEGWHGVRFTDPIGRTREYVHIVRQAMTRRRLVAAGEHFTLPLPDGEGKALLLSLQPVRPAVPIYLAAVGPKNLALTGEIADGWLAIFFDPDSGNGEIDRIHAAATAAGRDPAAIAISVQTPAAVGDTVAEAAELIRPHAALYLGGMGSRKTNFYHRIATSMGYGAQADQVQDRFLARDYAGAAAAVPLEFLSRTCLLGDESTIADRLRALAAGGVSGVDVGVSGQDKERAAETLQVVRRAADQAGVLGARG